MAPKIIKVSPCFCECGDHAWTAIGHGFVTLVSPEDSHFLERKWHAGGPGHKRPVRTQRTGTDTHTVYLHREIQPLGEMTDHKDRNPLDNRRTNLRPADKGENCRNSSAQRRKIYSEFKGVTLNHGRWCARIRFDGQPIWLGNFDTELQAAEAYDAAARRLFGDFAAPNFEGEQRVGA